jgi:phosphatidylglycerol---prolipoprotein diacylglyceryl transferase
MEFQAEHILIQGTPFGNLQVRYYGIIIVTAMLIAAGFAARLAQRSNRDPDHIWGALTWAIFPGIIGARLWFVTFPPVFAGRTAADYYSNFFNLTSGAIAVWDGGLHIFGAVIGGLIGVWLYFGPLHNPVGRVFHYIFLPITLIFEAIAWIFTAAYQRVRGQDVDAFKIPEFEKVFPDEGMRLSPWLDIAGVTLPLAQAIGRWANYINQELYGTPTSLPWGISIAQEKRVGEYASGVEYPLPGTPDETLFHPLFLYESLWNLIAFFVLAYLYNNNQERFNLRDGDFFLLYLIQYSFVRFWLEFIRVQQAIVELGGVAVNTSQVVTVVVFLGALATFVVRRRGSSQSTEETAQPA